MSEIGRALNDPAPGGADQDREPRLLAWQLGRPGLEERVTDNLVEEGAPHIKRDTLLLIDPSDISPARGGIREKDGIPAAPCPGGSEAHFASSRFPILRPCRWHKSLSGGL